MPHGFSSWLSHPVLIWSLCGFSLVAVALSVLFVPRYLASLPRDYLHHPQRPEGSSMPLRIARNLLGIVLIVLGIAMLLLPGQGLLTLLVGVLLTDFPGKQRLIVRVLGRPRVLAIVNKLRLHRGAAALEV